MYKRDHVMQPARPAEVAFWYASAVGSCEVVFQVEGPIILSGIACQVQLEGPANRTRYFW